MKDHDDDLVGEHRQMTCKGICYRHKALKPMGAGRYSSEQKRCQICEIFIKWEGIWCPCCGYGLRTRPRNLKYKAKLRERANIFDVSSKTLQLEFTLMPESH